MREVGRRGSVSFAYEIIISLILLGLFAAVVYLYIDANADGSLFWSKVHALDLSTTADLTIAPDGDVLMRYDNLKPQHTFGFWLQNGKVTVAPLPEEAFSFTAALSGAKTERILDLTEPQEGFKATRYYGLARSYPRPGFLENPTFLALKKVDEGFGILPADLSDTTCQAVTPPVPKDDAKVQLTITGSYSDAQKARVKEALKATLRGTPIVIVENGGTIPVSIATQPGKEMSLTLSPQGAAGAGLACNFGDMLALVSLGGIAPPSQPTAQGAGFGFSATITISNDEYLTPEHVGRALGLAIAQVYR